MADNLTTTTTVATPPASTVFATDDISSVHYPRTKVSLGADGTANDWKAGAGSVDTGTARVTLASDDPAVALLGTIDTDTSGIITSVQLIDDAIVADDAAFTPATTKVMMAGFEFDDNTPDSVNEGDGGAARMSANRNQYVQIRDNAGNERGLNIDASGNIAVTQSGTWTEANSSAIAASLSVLDDWDNTASDGASVSGDVAHDAADAGEPVKIGAKAANALPTAVANNDRANAIADLFGRILTAHIDPAMQVKKSYNTTSQQTGADVWSPTSGKKIAVTSLIIGTYGTTAGRLILWFGANADTTYSEGTDEALFKASFAPSATVKPGAVVNFNPPFFAATADHEIHITTDAALSVDIVVVGYEF